MSAACNDEKSKRFTEVYISTPPLESTIGRWRSFESVISKLKKVIFVSEITHVDSLFCRSRLVEKDNHVFPRAERLPCIRWRFVNRTGIGATATGGEPGNSA
jgi:hypothetical protein